MQESKSNIAFLRKHYGGLIGATQPQPDEEAAMNVFSDAQPYHIKIKNEGSLSLSVYNKAQALARPKAVEQNILKGLKGLEAVAVDEEGNPVEQAAPDTRIADMKNPEGLSMLARTAT